jgi:hypothetical protein
LGILCKEIYNSLKDRNKYVENIYREGMELVLEE